MVSRVGLGHTASLLDKELASYGHLRARRCRDRLLVLAISFCTLPPGFLVRRRVQWRKCLLNEQLEGGHLKLLVAVRISNQKGRARGGLGADAEYARQVLSRCKGLRGS